MGISVPVFPPDDYSRFVLSLIVVAQPLRFQEFLQVNASSHIAALLLYALERYSSSTF